MDATCPCHTEWHSATSFYDHLAERHGVSRDQAFLLAQLAVLGCELSYVVDADGDIILTGAQLPLEGLF